MIRKKILPIFLLSTALLVSGCSTLLGLTTDTPITQNPAERTWGTVIDDGTIEDYAQVNIEKTNPAFQQARVVVVSYNGIVLLAGQVPSDALKKQATEVVQRLKKVRKVHNEMTIGGPIGWPARSSDSWLTSKIRSKLFVDNQIPSGNMKVVTENGVVYLMGLVTPEEGKLAVKVVQNTYGVQKIVQLFEYVHSSDD